MCSIDIASVERARDRRRPLCKDSKQKEPLIRFSQAPLPGG